VLRLVAYGGGVPGGPFEGLDLAAAPYELVAAGGALDVPTLVAAYRAGCFPWPASGRHARALDRQARALARTGEVRLLPGAAAGPLVPWVSPHPRAVVLPSRLHVPRTVRQLLRRSGWTTTVDACFPEVLAACAHRPGEGTWITDGMRAGYTALPAAGAAHSLEVWDGTELVGGLYGVLTGRVFSGESMFHRASGASKVAVVDLCARLVEAGIALLDTQQETEHLAAMGQVLVSRADYLQALSELRDAPAVLPTGRREVARLGASAPPRSSPPVLDGEGDPL
jgi:leucyl/phenylalanyl-tRNA--protein transferase